MLTPLPSPGPQWVLVGSSIALLNPPPYSPSPVLHRQGSPVPVLLGILNAALFAQLILCPYLDPDPLRAEQEMLPPSPTCPFPRQKNSRLTKDEGGVN